MRKRMLLGACVPILVAVAVAGCSVDSPSSSRGQMMGSHIRPADVNASDVMFVQMMIPHHEQAVEMAALAPQQASSAKVKALAVRIADAQGPEIAQMRGWLDEWNLVEMTDHAGHMASGLMRGIMSEKEMAALKDSDGAAFDRLFLTMMIEHHEGAIDMAKDGLAEGENKPVLALEKAVVTSQTAEIAQMKGMLPG